MDKNIENELETKVLEAVQDFCNVEKAKYFPKVWSKMLSLIIVYINSKNLKHDIGDSLGPTVALQYLNCLVACGP